MASNTKIDVKQFSYTDRETDIKLWLKRFKYAVIAILAFDATEEEKEVAYIRHLPPNWMTFVFKSLKHLPIKQIGPIWRRN